MFHDLINIKSDICGRSNQVFCPRPGSMLFIAMISDELVNMFDSDSCL